MDNRGISPCRKLHDLWISAGKAVHEFPANSLQSKAGRRFPEWRRAVDKRRRTVRAGCEIRDGRLLVLCLKPETLAKVLKLCGRISKLLREDGATAEGAAP